MATTKLTKTSAAAHKARDGKRQWLYDGGSVASVPGLALEAAVSGTRTWWYQYRLAGGPSRRVKIGLYPGEYTLDAARKRAGELARQVRAGIDPREALADAERAKASRKTVRDLRDRYMEEHAATKKAASSRRCDEILWDTHILPALGDVAVEAVTVADVGELHHAMRDTPFQANRMLALVSKAFNLASRWGWRDVNARNPADGALHDRYPERKVKRGTALGAEQLRRVGEALDALPPSPARSAFVFFALVGCRPAEACSLRWEDVDLDGRTVHLPESKTGPRSLTLGAPAADLLAALPRDGEFVFPSDRKPGAPVSTLRYVGDAVRKAAKLPAKIRNYDTRHTFISTAHDLGLDDRTAKAVSGHAPPSGAHERYVHRSPQSLVRAADTVSGAMYRALFGGETEARVLPFAEKSGGA